MAIHNWRTLREKMPPERRARVDEAVRRELLVMELAELRREAGKTEKLALGESDDKVAAIAEMTQAELSKFERREDHLISTLRRYVTALGGELEVVAVFDNKRISLKGV